MNIIRISFLVLFFGWIGCSKSSQDTPYHKKTCDCDSTDTIDTINGGSGALLGSRFHSLDELKTVIQIEYFNNNSASDSTVHSGSKVCLTDCSNGKKVVSVLDAGTRQGDFSKAKNGTMWNQMSMLVESPYAVSHRKDLEKVFLLSRRMSDLFGEGDPAFYDLSQAAVKNINTPDLAFLNARDSSDKGYLNSFDHISAQAFITSIFSEELSDFVGDAHERDHPELITGKFSDSLLHDLDNGPVDNYVDLVNNEWGQELGKELKKKYHISVETIWTHQLLANYLNDLQSYYSWAFQIGFRPFNTEDEIVIRFSEKLNLVMRGKVKVDKT